MKKLVSIALFSLTFGLTLASADVDTWSQPGRLTAQAGLGLYWGGLGEVQGGVDYGLAQVPFAPQFVVDFGVSGRIAAATAGVGAGAYGTAHYSFRNLRTGQDWVDRFELGLGIGVGILPHVGLDAYGNLSYHFDKRWAAYLEGAPFGTVIGASYRF